jgi:hypothetical protein
MTALCGSQRFEPSGMTNDEDIRITKSIVDYIFRWFGKKFLTVDQQEEVGIFSTEVKAKMAAAYANGGSATAAPATGGPPAPGQMALFNAHDDAVECARCGGRIPNGQLLPRAETAARIPAVAERRLVGHVGHTRGVNVEDSISVLHPNGRVSLVQLRQAL